MFSEAPLGHLRNRKDCPNNSGVLISGVEDVLYQSITDHLVPAECVHNRGVSAIQGAGLEGCLQFRGLD